ncbi:MAG: excinuclease ABC subunit UvrC [Candidatus Theseobacter exili]|nr:excinuclease ABC subunit UvrC [Candidatus Theseobacter exili]
MNELLVRKLKEIANELPDRPGIYLMRGEMGEVLYVGKARALKKRVKSYFVNIAKHHPKTKQLVEHIRDIEVHVLKSEEEALLLECRYIKEFRPRYNVLLKDDKTYPMVKITEQHKFPRLEITRFVKPDGSNYLGPFSDSGALRRTVHLLNRVLGLRTCTVTEPNQRTCQHCLDFTLGNCKGPCIGNISEKEYREHVLEASRILAGRSKDLLRVLRKKMENASEALDFEKAAGFRDSLNALNTVMGTHTGPVMKFKKILQDKESELQAIQKKLNLQKTPVRIEAFDISNLSGKEATGSMVVFINGQPDKRYYRRFRIRTVHDIDDYAMMRELIIRRFAKIRNERGSLPDLVLIDGGKGHLNAAMEAIKELSLNEIVFAGLAKRLEEVFIQGQKEPLPFEKNSPGLHLLMHIRDEAHRFAIQYHRKLRKKRIAESVLDDISGIGLVKKKWLIRKFGSVRRLKEAEPLEIASVSGIGMKLAKEILYNLNSGK